MENKAADTFNDIYSSSELPDDLILKKAGEDLTLQASQGGISEVYHREKELEQIIKILGMRKKGNPIILGEAGVGKTVLANYLALKIIRREVPPWLRGKKIVRTSFLALWSQVKNSDYPWPEYGKKLNEVIDFCVEHPVILFMDEIHTIFNHPISMDMVKPALSSGKLKMIGATTFRDYQRFIVKDEATARRFEPVYLKEPSSDLTIKILRSLKKEFEQYYNLTIEDKMIDFLVQCANNYIHNRYQPDKSITLLERTLINCAYEGKREIKKEDIETTLSEVTGIPDHILRKGTEHIHGLEAALNFHVLGQKEAIAKIAKRLLITKSKSTINLKRPNGIFLLTGPTGVGKTELAKAIVLHMTGSEDNLIRLDMSSYATPGTIYSLLGGSTNPERPEVPFLTYQVRSKPNGVLLLDEIEKAHKDIWMLFLQVFDAGRILDYLGNEIFFENITILMTANIGFDPNEAIIEYPHWKSNWGIKMKNVLEEIKKTFPPEFLGRIDDILILKPLSNEIMKGFVEQKRVQLEKQNEKSLFLSEKAIDLIIEEGFDKEYGARKLNHALDELLGSLLAECKLGSDWETIESISFDKDQKKSRLKIAKIKYRQH